MIKHLKPYYEFFFGGGGGGELTVSLVSDCLLKAIKDGVTELVISSEEYNTILNYMVYNGAWDWDKKTFMGIKFIIQNV